MAERDRHSLLKRQLKRHFGDKPIPPEWEDFLSAVDSAYREFDADRRMLERSLELSSLELISANSDMRAIFQAIPDRFFRIDFDGKIFDYKAGSEADSHFPLKSIIGRSIDDLLPIHAASKFEEAIGRVRETKSTVTIEYSLEKSGTEAHYEARFLPYSTSQIIVMIRNISERKNMQAQLIFSDRMASIGTIAAGVAHEINNPLSYMISNISFAARAIESAIEDVESPSLGPVLDALKESSEGAQRVRQIVRDLKTFSRSDDERRERLDVKMVLEGAIKMVRTEIAPRAQLVLAFGEIPRVEANPGRLGQVFLNLLINAAQSIPDGAPKTNTITVVTRTDEERRAVIEFADTGVGIREEDLPRIFDPFFTTKPPDVGTGLGLAICQAIVTALGGEMTVESRYGQGSIFRVHLPGVQAQRAAGEARGVGSEDLLRAFPKGREIGVPEPLGRTLKLERGRVLVVDDEQKIGVALTRALESDHEVVSVTNAPAALDRIRRGEEFDVILCDLIMPEMSGMEFFHRLETLVPAMRERVVFITGGAYTEAAREFLKQVPNRRLTKPIDIQKLREMLAGQQTRGAPRTAG